jgi:cellulose synthase/poly-beta-1,6-N-acetylglucosamine synthase-like glycosyltransferase
MRQALLAALLAGLALCALAVFPAAASAVPGPVALGRPSADEGARMAIFRVDVSRYPAIGLVVTVPGGARTLPADDFLVTVGGVVTRPKVKQLSPDDVQLVLAPDVGLAQGELAAERFAATRFLTGLPAKERTVTVNPDTPGVLPEGLSGDPAPAVLRAANLAAGREGDVASRLATALSAFTTGPQVRRTIVLAVANAEPLSAPLAARFRAQLAASGTLLYVLDAAPGGAPAYDALAAGTGGFAVPVRVPAAWSLAFAQIGASLNEQYYLRFTDTGPLPGYVHVVVSTPAGHVRATWDLPVHNPVAPALPQLTPPGVLPAPFGPSWDHPLVLLAIALIVFGISYGMAMLAASRREPRRPPQHALDRAPAPPGELFFVFLMPCLNEEAVIRNSLQRLLSIPGENFVVLVIDDGSDDDTPDIVATLPGDRVWLLRRRPPEARQGKGEALNAGIRYLISSGLLDGRAQDQVIAVVVDADGRLDPESIEQVTPIFADPTIGAVQIGVRINNRGQSRLARMQDMEFVIYTEVFQRGRRHLGSVGLGGNGQFMRLSAILSLGSAPWTRSLTDDLDLGVRMIAAGWRNEYCSAVAVHQQGVVELGRLVRQRSRWFQGHLQSWKLIPLVLRDAPKRARADLLYHLSSPAVLLIASLLSASFMISLANALLMVARGQDPAGWWIASTYALSFGPALALSSVYWARERRNGVGALRTVMFAHMYVCYGMMWYAAGWWAVGRTLRGRTGWAKTDRVAESPLPSGATVSSGAVSGGIADGARPVVALAGFLGAPVPAEGAARESAYGTPPVSAEGTPPVPAEGALPEPAERAPLAPAAPCQSGPTGGPPRHRRRKRRRVLVVAAAAVLACTAVAGVASTRLAGHGSPPGWVEVFSGYGSTSITGSGAVLAVSLTPERATTPETSHSALVVSARFYADFAETVQVRTVQQLRSGRAGRPKPWEVAWVVWHYTSNQRFYAVTLEQGGWELSKQDPAYPGGERFLASGLSPAFRLGVPHTVGIVQVGNQITVSADGQILTRFTDTRDPYLSGAAGFYTEDAQVTFDHVRVSQLPGERH